MAIQDLPNDIKRRMGAAVDALKKDLNGLRTGRASVNLLEPVMVESYGQMMPLNQVGTVSIPEPRLLAVSVWDKGSVKAVEKAIRDAGLGLNPSVDGQTVRVPLPELNQERRQELTKVAGKYAEQARVAVRNVRRDGMEALKKAEKAKEISEDEERRAADDIQKLTDKAVADIEVATKQKEADLMAV